MVRIYKNSHDRSGRQAGVRLFARSISVRRTSDSRLIIFTVRKRMIFYKNFAKLRCSTQIGTFNSNLLEHVAKLCFFFFRIKRDKTSSASNKLNIIAQNSYDVSTLREISAGLSSNR